jgi:hypothetical protein
MQQQSEEERSVYSISLGDNTSGHGGKLFEMVIGLNEADQNTEITVRELAAQYAAEKKKDGTLWIDPRLSRVRHECDIRMGSFPSRVASAHWR